jgi:hypothetical protein
MKSPSGNDRTFFLVILAVACSGVITAACGGGGGRVGSPPPMSASTTDSESTSDYMAPPTLDTAPLRVPATSAPRTKASAPVDPYAAIDSILERMSNGNIAFNAPQLMSIEDTATIQLKLGLNTEISDLKRLIESEGAKEGFIIKVAERMEARLTGQNFAITAITPEVQAISRNEITSWSWEVKPKAKGKQYLHLTLTALIGTNGNSTPRTLRTFSKSVNVKVTQAQQLESFVGQNWQWLWATLLVPIAGWAWKSKTNRN